MTPEKVSMAHSRKIISYELSALPQIQENGWQVVRFSIGRGDDVNVDQLPIGKLILPFSWWIHNGSKPEVMKRALRGDIGVWFSADEDVLTYAELIHAGKKLWPLMAIDFPIFRDGRGYSTARLLRERLGWVGEIRAIGDVLTDQLLQMARVGFDSFDLRGDQDAELALRQFSLYTVTLQNSWRGRRSVALTMESTGLTV